MKAILLCGGKGTRISRYLNGKPKCLVSLGEQSLIEYTVKLLQSQGISDIIICLGYQADHIVEELKNYKIEFVYNPFFDITNSIISLWFAEKYLTCEEDIMIMNGDVFLSESILKQVIQTEKSPVLFSDERRKLEADYKLKYEFGILSNYGKELSLEDTTGEYVGMAKISQKDINLFKMNLKLMVNCQKHHLWWENVLYDLSDSKSIFVETVDDFWAEVDYIEDYQRILEYL